MKYAFEPTPTDADRRRLLNEKVLVLASGDNRHSGSGENRQF